MAKPYGLVAASFFALSAIGYAYAQTPPPNAIFGTYDPASGKFAPADQPTPDAAKAINQTISFTPKFVFKSTSEKLFTTIRCTITVRYHNGVVFASKSNDFGPGDAIMPLTINVELAPGGSTLLNYDVSCNAVDTNNQQHSQSVTDNAVSATGGNYAVPAGNSVFTF